MKRSPMPRRSSYLERHTRLRARNPERAARRQAEAFGDCARMARLLPCCVCLALPPSDPAHVLSRGAGGKDWANCAPLCRRHHSEQHHLGLRSFELRHGIDLGAVAAHVADGVRRHECTAWPGTDGRCLVCLSPLGEEPCP